MFPAGKRDALQSCRDYIQAFRKTAQINMYLQDLHQEPIVDHIRQIFSQIACCKPCLFSLVVTDGPA